MSWNPDSSDNSSINGTSVSGVSVVTLYSTYEDLLSGEVGILSDLPSDFSENSSESSFSEQLN